jgi:hypothetical protein
MKLAALLPTLVLAGCAGLSSTVDRDTVSSWRQRPDEKGLLPAGSVLSVERVWFQRNSTPPAPAYASPQMAATGVAVLPIAEAIRNADWVYRHRIRMKTGETKVVDLSYEFKVGDCVAFRSGLQKEDTLAIPALLGECQ